MCEGGAAIFTGFKTILSYLHWFHVVQSLVGESILTLYSSSNPLNSSSVGSFCCQDFNIQAMAFLNVVADVPPCIGFDFGGIVPVGQVLVTNNYECFWSNESMSTDNRRFFSCPEPTP